MRTLILQLCLVILCGSAAAQPAFNSSAFTLAFKKILQSSFTDFKDIRGEKIGVKDSFKSKVVLPGAAYTYIDFLGLGTYHARLVSKTVAENEQLAKQVNAAVSKAYRPGSVKMTSTSGEGYTQYRFTPLTSKGLLNNRVTINEFHQVKKGRIEVDIFVSAIAPREFVWVKKEAMIRDDSLKQLVIALLKSARESFWDDITDSTAITAEDADLKDIIDFEKEGLRHRTTLQAPGAITYIETDKSGFEAAFIMLYRLPAASGTQTTAAVNKILQRLHYALPKNYATEKKKTPLAESAYFSTIYPTLDYQPPVYEGIEVETEQVFSHGDGQAYLSVKFLLSRSFFNAAAAPLDY